MGAQLLKIHWKAAKWPLLPFLVALAGVPLFTARLLLTVDGSVPPAGAALDVSQGIGMFYPVLAALIGAVVALTAWNWDHQTNHVYPLSLPISRARYAALKFATGAVIMVLPGAVLLASAWSATFLMELPTGLETYPLALTVHFLAAGLSVYGLLFALASGRMRTAVLVLSTATGLLVFGDALGTFVQEAVPSLEYVDLSGMAVDFLIDEGGPLHVFTSNWSLIDV